MGPARQSSVGTHLWDLAIGPARQVGCGIRSSDLPWDPPTWSDLADGTSLSASGTRPWDPLSESISGTQLSGWLVGSGYQAKIY
jgi:hypothetical protein